MEVPEHTTGLKQRPVKATALNNSGVQHLRNHKSSDSDAQLWQCLVKCSLIHHFAFIIRSR